MEFPRSESSRRGISSGLTSVLLWVGFTGIRPSQCRWVEIRSEAAKLVQVTEEALYLGIKQAVVGNRLSDISHAVQQHVETAGFSVVTEFVGHGIGRQLHEEPQVPNYGKPGQGPRLQTGMVLAIEPMVNMGRRQFVFLRIDGLR